MTKDELAAYNQWKVGSILPENSLGDLLGAALHDSVDEPDMLEADSDDTDPDWGKEKPDGGFPHESMGDYCDWCYDWCDSCETCLLSCPNCALWLEVHIKAKKYGRKTAKSRALQRFYGDDRLDRRHVQWLKMHRPGLTTLINAIGRAIMVEDKNDAETGYLKY